MNYISNYAKISHTFTFDFSCLSLLFTFVIPSFSMKMSDKERISLTSREQSTQESIEDGRGSDVTAQVWK